MDKEEVKEETINEIGPEYIEGAKELVEMFPFLNMQTASLVIGALGAAGLAGFSAIVAKVQDMALAGKFGGAAKSFAEKLQAAGGAAAKATQNREGVEAVNEEVENIDENMDVIYELIQMFPFLTNSTAQMLLGVFGAVGITGVSAIASKIHQMAKDGVFGEKGKQIGDKLTDVGSAAASARNVSEESEELNEALQTVKILRNQLQEVNLLNAKLLYVNKVFKSNNLSEGQKVNVIAAFDRAETVKEVKLVFETVSKNVVAKPTTIKEHRSFASKATGNAQTTAPKEILSEVSEQVSRWQKLAGIIK
jgi:type II secretory pathway pseudopilin PulG